MPYDISNVHKIIYSLNVKKEKKKLIKRKTRKKEENNFLVENNSVKIDEISNVEQDKENNIPCNSIDLSSHLKIGYTKELHEAIQMAECFENGRDKQGHYHITEGWDLYDIIHSLVIINRILRNTIQNQKIMLESVNNSNS